jgi:hypothetical protein
MEKYITNGFLKITNPQLQKNSTYKYDGPIQNQLFDFNDIIPTQTTNYTRIESILNTQQIYFTKINIVKWNSQKGYGSPYRCKFIVETTHPYLLWYKYDSEALGGSNNLIYYKNQKIKTTDFIDWTENKLIELLQQ